MAFGSGRKEDERYCYNCMAILPTKIVQYAIPVEKDSPLPFIEKIEIVCLRCNKEIKPPEEIKDDKNTGS